MFQLFRAAAPFRYELHRTEMLRHAETQTQPLGRTQRVDQNAITLRITFCGVEQHRRRTTPLVDDVRDPANFQIPVGAFDGADLAKLVGLFEPTPQAVWLFHTTKPLNAFKPFNRFALFEPFKSFRIGTYNSNSETA